MKIKKSYIHFIIGLAIMIVFRFIPAGILPNVTEVGMQIIGIFIGTIYLWTTIDPTVGSLTCIAMICFSDYASASDVIVSCFGNATVVQMFFLMIYMGALTNRRLTVYIGRWIMTRKMVEGRPWVFTSIILVGSFLMAAFVSPFAPVFLFWPILYGVFDDVGYKKTDKYPRLMTHAVVLACLVGFPVPPYMSNGLALLGNYRGLLANYETLAAMEGVTISNALYCVFTVVMGLILIASIVLVMRFVFKPDVKPMEDVTIEMLNKNPLPPMDMSQKVCGVSLIIFIAIMLLPSIFPNAPVLSFLNNNSYALGIPLVIVLSLLKFDDSPVLNFSEVMGKEFAWPTYWLCTSAILLGSVLTNEATGITAFLNTVLSPLFTGMSVMTFSVILLVVTVVLTNICNSLVIGMILQPVVLTYCATASVNPAPMITLLIFTVLLSASVTPAASPFAAMLFGNKEYLTSGEVYKYSLTYVVVELLLIIVIGIPLVNLLL